MRRTGGFAAVLLGVLVSTGAALAAPGGDGSAGRVAVAAFAAESKSDGEWLSGRVRAGLAAQGVGEVAGPDALPGVSGVVGAAALREAAASAGVDSVVVGALHGQTLRVELRGGHSGGVVARYESQLGEDATQNGAAIDALSARLAEALNPRAGAAGAAAPATGEPGGALPPVGVGPLPSEADDLAGSLKSDEPIEIESDQLDVVSRKGERHLVFRRNVRVTQGDVSLRTQKLDAFYPAGSSRPERLVAEGDVHVQQGDRSASCDRATYDREDALVVCDGRAELVQGCDVVRGGRIEIDLAREHFRVTEAASVVLGGEGTACDRSAS